MAKIIFTFRPVQLKKPISWINAITRLMQGYPRDHVSILHDGQIFESIVGPGVQKISLDDWAADRIGTDVVIYEVPAELIDFELFDRLLKAGIKYDIRAAIYHLFGFEEKLMNRAEVAVNCSELVAMMLKMENAYKALPEDVEYYLRDEGFESDNQTISKSWQA